MSAPRDRALVVGLALLLVVLLALAGAARRLARAEGRAATAMEGLLHARAQGAEIQALRGRRERVEARERPQQDVIAQLNAVLAEAGIRSDALAELQPVADAAVVRPGERSYRRQAVGATLEELSIEQVGRFLARWRERQPAWVPTRIELYHVKGQTEPALLYTMRVVLTALHLAS